MTNNELRELLTKRAGQADEMLALIKGRPHHNRMFNETLRMASRELKEAAEFWLDHLGEPGIDEEGIKDHLAPRYDEFMRCRDRVVRDFAEMDEADA